MYKKYTKFKNVALSTVARLHKKSRRKRKKIKTLYQVLGLILGKEMFC
jgi:hypothetical protein